MPREDKGLAQAYYLAAQKRFGILESTVIDIQCFYLAATYEKHVFRALPAWLLLQQACVRLRARLQRKRWDVHEDDSNNRIRRAEQRLYWSCVNAERYLCLRFFFACQCLKSPAYFVSRDANNFLVICGRGYLWGLVDLKRSIILTFFRLLRQGHSPMPDLNFARLGQTNDRQLQMSKVGYSTLRKYL